jgi:hypothetical protein
MAGGLGESMWSGLMHGTGSWRFTSFGSWPWNWKRGSLFFQQWGGGHKLLPLLLTMVKVA